ncbi:MAG: ParB/RepB/Spo0J family partition protein [Bacteroidetes bacterium]|jgi:ParB family chromosome partitioning protein|nr:ParB/RepB/Spo0J family partition protein [Bacteroidota bacterium]
MAKRNALGKGLGALIESGEETSVKELAPEVEGVNEIPVEAIEANPFQPRKNFDEEALEELADSIRELGIIQPLTVREIGEKKYQLIAGERRWRAARLAGVETLPAFVRTANDQGMLELALVENIQREDLDAIEVAISYQRLMDECELTQELLGTRVGKKRATITNYLRLLKLPAEVQLGIRARKLSMGHARTLINVDDEEEQLKLFYRIIEEDLSVRKVEELVKKLKEPKEEKSESKPSSNGEIPQEYQELKDQLAGFFHTKIDFKRNNNGSGKIVIPFKSDEELERIIATLDTIKT